MSMTSAYVKIKDGVYRDREIHDPDLKFYVGREFKVVDGSGTVGEFYKVAPDGAFAVDGRTLHTPFAVATIKAEDLT